MKLLIQSCPHSGTRYTHKFLTELGLNIGHERIDRCGSVTWRRDKKHHEYNEEEYIYLHQVREPLASIGSFHHLSKDAWKHISLKSKIHRYSEILHKSMLLYYRWHKYMEKRSLFTYQVEQITDLVDILDLFKIEYDKDKIEDTINMGRVGQSSSKTYIGWLDLFMCDEKLAKKILVQSMRYGY